MKRYRVLAEDEINKIENNITNLFLGNNTVYKDLNEFLCGNSKRIRSLVALLYLKANNVTITDDVIMLLSSGELLHNASLLHDDVIDDADERRGIITISKKYNSKISVLSGDYLLSFAIDYINSLDNKMITNIFVNITRSMSEAEVSQYLSRNKHVGINEYIAIIEGKTASLFEGILKSSAILANIDSATASDFGKMFGILFQIKNDLTEESAENDKKNGVKTAVDIIGIEKTNALKDNYKEKMRAILKQLPDNKYNKGLEDLVNLL